MPQDEFETALFRKARELEDEGVDGDDITAWFQHERAENARRLLEQSELQEKPQAKPRPARRPR